ncbi:MAG: hypothetical protein AVDCRST_MAG08-4603 [uncultured Acetobacteraceae bacterium]|uniref:Uncharacterized protein n=1 Tax=uncultured Acetobacteraceae bacterium TaxID=169975 RepID=A0A6J4JYT6_9PROT|nr:MAG: hypothetical protein AVDCRST_MAG08-4603 [uncultured Acetobacteraceae bacterium]
MACLPRCRTPAAHPPPTAVRRSPHGLLARGPAAAARRPALGGPLRPGPVPQTRGEAEGATKRSWWRPARPRRRRTWPQCM